MVSADVVGFHSFDHARHFLNTTKRILGIRYHTRQGGMISLTAKDREV
jgi:trehalose 6-phosphate synthase/phosphatase